MNKYTSLALLGLAALPVNGFFLMPCWPVSSQRLDPIVDPGKVSDHVHQIAGGSSFAPVMSYNDTQASNCTTCFVKEDKSNYWIPALYMKHADGSYERVPQVGSASMYYFNEPSRLGPGEKFEAFPEGLRMLAGDPDKRTGGTDAASEALNYKCLNYAGSPTDFKTFPTTNCPDGVRAEVTYPSCWDGTNLDSADHKSHMAYPLTDFENGPCPSTHPHHLVTLKVEFIFDTNQYKDEWTNGQQPFLWAQGDPTGYGLHADYMMGWNYDLLSAAVDQCMDEFGVLENCAPFAGKIQSAYVNPDTCVVDSFVDEDIGGTVPALPTQTGFKLEGKWADYSAAASPEATSPSAETVTIVNSVTVSTPTPTTTTTTTTTTTAAAAPAQTTAGWNRWRRDFGDGVQKHHLGHLRHLRLRQLNHLHE